MPSAFTDPSRPHPARRTVLCAAALLTASAARAAPQPTKDRSMTDHDASGLDDFDFLFGDWQVRHHKLNKRLAGDDSWSDFTGRTLCRRLTQGLGNLDENQLDDPAGPYAAMTVRYFNPATRLWTIYWVDSRRPQMEPAVSGAFKDGVGLFYADDIFEGRPIKVRFRWSADPRSPRWEQAFSPDAGATWEVNWVMDFTRAAG